ncbi:hypothetical protein MKY04_18170 [Lysinibacillus telephonicus]|uniref:hypothetical protein n=1 Tax=Lysinibacillus telephonicus TaxID=1714840 RepID=UPI0031FC5FFB
MVFKELKESIRNISLTIASNNLDSMYLDLEVKKLEALRQIKQYIQSMDWLSQSRTKERIRMYLIYDCDAERTAQHYKIKRNTMDVAVSYASKKLIEHIGEKTIEQITNAVDENEIEKAIERFNIGTQKIQEENFFLTGVKKLFPKPKRNKFMLLAECEQELILLLSLSNFTIEHQISKVDKEKLSHLLSFLESNSPSHEKDVLNYLLRGELVNREEGIVNIKSQVTKALEVLNSGNFYKEG